MSDLVTRLSVLAEDDGDRYPAHVKKLAEAAASRIAALEVQLAEARKALEASASALDEAREDVEHWGSYAGEYFQNKHDLEGDLDRIAKQASAARRALKGGQVE